MSTTDVKQSSLALVIATYNWPEALKLVLESVLVQTVMPDEILIADDGSGYATKLLIDAYRDKFNIPLRHFWQEDNGFRKTLIMNQAIASTDCEYIVQVDGDIVLNTHFIEDHRRVAEKGHYIRGSRVQVSDIASKGLIRRGYDGNMPAYMPGISNRINALRSLLLSRFFIKKSKRSNNVIGCNCAYWRADFVKVNGYNCELNGWGHEDIELASRFINSGLSQKKVKMMAVCYHLHHPLQSRFRESVNYNIYQETARKGIMFCAKGLTNLRY
ncbi:MAG: glycosyltransferase family 2 protein [Chitinophagaceae bacterium]|nr:glycosyltransferase family 2 protein [Chitinophagaceae bacterium]